MRAVLAAVGSRGDVEPMVALGERLVAAGHRVSLVTHASLLGDVPASIETVGADSDPAELLAGPAADALRHGNVRALNRTRHIFADFLHAFAEPTASRLPGSDVLIASTFATAAVDAAMRERVPVVRAHFWPEYPHDHDHDHDHDDVDADERQFQRIAERSAERTAERIAERPAQCTAERIAERQALRTAERTAERQALRTAERTAERQPERTAERTAERTCGRDGGSTAEPEPDCKARRDVEPAPDAVIPLAPYSWLAPPPARRALARGIDGLGQYMGGVDGQWRRGRLYLTARHPSGFTTNTHGSLYAFSPVVSMPRGPDSRATGWWRRADADRAHLSDGTHRLLAQPGPWIGVGFGSMPQRSRDRLLALISSAVTRVGVRAIVQFPGVTGDVAPGVVAIGYEPHEALFPRLAAVVHHGGSGTSGSALRAGVPSVVVPHFADQFYWGRRLAQLGIAARPIPRPVLTAGTLARRLEAVLGPAIADRAAGLGARVAAEDGTGQAVDLLEDRFARS